MKYDSIFDVIGPIMVGPSSSHTAGACQIGFITQKLFGEMPENVKISLHGSFAETYRGHGTNLAIVAGLLGFPPDDIRIPKSYEFAQQFGMHFTINLIDLGSDYHPNSVKLELSKNDQTLCVIASSIGGGNIQIKEIDGLEAGFSAEYPTIVCMNNDIIGVVAKITKVVSEYGLNIATMRLSRNQRKRKSLCWIEVNTSIPSKLKEDLEDIKEILSVRILNV